MADLDAQPTVSNQTLQKAVADLHSVSVWQGFKRFSILGMAVLGCLTFAWITDSEIGFWVSTIVGGVFYALWLICTHDATHHTLFGWPALEETLARMISWPMLWPVGVYSELHRLHHGWNGVDLRDPERYQWSQRAYDQASSPMRWYIRHQWVIHIFVLGGWGIIVKTLMDGWRWQGVLPRLRGQLWTDLLGMLLVQVCCITVVVLSHTSIWRYGLFWVCLERVVGAIAQVRAHLEHYGLWDQRSGQRSGHLTTQLYSSRNLRAAHWFGWLIGGLNYHAVHHGFPDIPFNQLPEAYGRVQSVLDEHGMPTMDVEPGYPHAVRKLINRYTLIR